MILLGTSEAARRIGVHPFTLRRWDESGKLKPIKDSVGRRLYLEEQIDQFIADREKLKASNSQESTGIHEG